MAMKMQPTFFNSSQQNSPPPPPRENKIYPTIMCKMDTSSEQGKKLAPKIGAFLIMYHISLWEHNDTLSTNGYYVFHLQSIKNALYLLAPKDINQPVDAQLANIRNRMKMVLDLTKGAGINSNLWSVERFFNTQFQCIKDKLGIDVKFSAHENNEKLVPYADNFIIPAQENAQSTPSPTP